MSFCQNGPAMDPAYVNIRDESHWAEAKPMWRNSGRAFALLLIKTVGATQETIFWNGSGRCISLGLFR